MLRLWLLLGLLLSLLWLALALRLLLWLWLLVLRLQLLLWLVLLRGRRPWPLLPVGSGDEGIWRLGLGDWLALLLRPL